MEYLPTVGRRARQDVMLGGFGDSGKKGDLLPSADSTHFFLKRFFYLDTFRSQDRIRPILA